MKSLDNEKYVLDSFKKGTTVLIEGIPWVVAESGKPKTQGGSGEPKTDVYVRLTADYTHGIEYHLSKELKISIKQSNYNFVENKLSMPRLANIMGEETARDIVGNGVFKLIREHGEELYRDTLVKDDVVRKKGEEPCKQYKLGWRLDMTNKPNAKRSFPLALSERQKVEMFTGECLDRRKRDAIVNGKIIPNSGVANLLLTMDLSGPVDPAHILDKCVPIDEEYIRTHDFQLYGTIKAVNYFSNGKYEHARPLLMFVEYNKTPDGTYRPMINFDPETMLGVNSTERAKVLQEIINK